MLPLTAACGEMYADLDSGDLQPMILRVPSPEEADCDYLNLEQDAAIISLTPKKVQ